MSFSWDHLNHGCMREKCRYIHIDRWHHVNYLQDHGVIECKPEVLVYGRGTGTGEVGGVRPKKRAVAAAKDYGYGEQQKDMLYRV